MRKPDELLQYLMQMDARSGLPEEIFLAVSTLVPIANVDLMIIDEEKGILLSWRDDEYYGQGWHLPGGCIRFKETMLERLQKTAMNEIGTEVEITETPLAVRDVILDKDHELPKLRAHHLAVLYECRLPKTFAVDNHNKTESDIGYLQWFRQIPKNILAVHDVYFDVFKNYGLMEKRL